jgi:hypothetical protein
MHSSGITIEDVNLQIEKSSRSIEGKVQVVISMKNNSKTLTYYVLKRPRTIEYDKDSRTLSIGLYEQALPQDITGGFEPEQIAILPDATLQWQYLIPVWMKKIMRPGGLREVVEVLDISDVQKVVCTVAYHTSPFRETWAETVSSSFERMLHYL